MIKFKCAWCGKRFKRYLSAVRNPKRVCCSRKCRMKLNKDSKLTSEKYLLDGKDPKKVLRKILLDAIDSELLRMKHKEKWKFDEEEDLESLGIHKLFEWCDSFRQERITKKHARGKVFLDSDSET